MTAIAKARFMITAIMAGVVFGMFLTGAPKTTEAWIMACINVGIVLVALGFSIYRYLQEG